MPTSEIAVGRRIDGDGWEATKLTAMGQTAEAPTWGEVVDLSESRWGDVHIHRELTVEGVVLRYSLGPRVDDRLDVALGIAADMFVRHDRHPELLPELLDARGRHVIACAHADDTVASLRAQRGQGDRFAVAVRLAGGVRVFGFGQPDDKDVFTAPAEMRLADLWPELFSHQEDKDASEADARPVVSIH